MMSLLIFVALFVVLMELILLPKTFPPLKMNLQTFATAGKSASFTVGGTAIGGLNDGNITINGETIDVTTFASGGWIERIQGLKSAEISLSGFYLSDDTTGQTVLRAALLSGDSVVMQALMDGTTGWSGSFLVTSFEDGAAVDGEVSRSISLESTGSISTV